MRTLLRSLPLIALFCAPLQVFGSTTATMQVSFTVLASCTVDNRGAAAPSVACAQTGGYLVAAQPAAPGAVAAPGAAGWTVYF